MLGWRWPPTHRPRRQLRVNRNYNSVISTVLVRIKPPRRATRLQVVDHRGRTRLTCGIDQSANAAHRARSGGEYFAAPAGPAAPLRGAAGLPAGRRARRHGRRNASATPPPACTRRCADFRARGGARDFFARPPARPEDRAGQGRRPRPDHRAARAGPLDRRDRHGAGPRRRRVEPHRDQRSDHRGRAAADLAPPRRRPRRAPPRRPAPGPCPGRRGLPRTQLTGGHPTRLAGLLLALPDLLALDLPGLVDAAGYPGTRDIPAISYLLVPARASSSPRPGGSPTSTTWPPTRPPPCSPA